MDMTNQGWKFKAKKVRKKETKLYHYSSHAICAYEEVLDRILLTYPNLKAMLKTTQEVHCLCCNFWSFIQKINPESVYFHMGFELQQQNHAKACLVVIWTAGTPRYSESTALQDRKEEWNCSHWKRTCSISRRKAMTLSIYQTFIVKGHRTSWKRLM